VSGARAPVCVTTWHAKRPRIGAVRGRGPEPGRICYERTCSARCTRARGDSAEWREAANSRAYKRRDCASVSSSRASTWSARICASAVVHRRPERRDSDRTGDEVTVCVEDRSSIGMSWAVCVDSASPLRSRRPKPNGAGFSDVRPCSLLTCGMSSVDVLRLLFLHSNERTTNRPQPT
jgi:hypothetical protein